MAPIMESERHGVLDIRLQRYKASLTSSQSVVCAFHYIFCVTSRNAGLKKHFLSASLNFALLVCV